LQRHIEALENSLIQPWASDKKWEQFINEVIQLCKVLKKFVAYLNDVNKRMRCYDLKFIDNFIKTII